MKRILTKIRDWQEAGGWRNFSSQAARDYFHLMRFQDMTGSWLLLWPSVWSIMLAQRSFWPTLGWLIIFFIGTISMRAAGCIVNDIIDRDLDEKVERTANRPLASRRLTIKQALIPLAVNLNIAVLLLIFFNSRAVIGSLVFFILALIYPLSKYYLKLPQLFLGITFNGGALVAWLAIYGRLNVTPMLIYLGCVAWTFAYDTIYSYQDYQDDSILGVKSSALYFGLENTDWLSRSYIIAIIFWFFAGAMSQMALGYYLALALVTLIFVYQVRNVNLKDRALCYTYFRQNTYIGPILILGIIVDRVFS